MTGFDRDTRKLTVTVFGGTGFLGRRVVDCLAERGVAVRVAARHPEQVARGDVQAVKADVLDPASVARAVEGSDGAVNAISLYVETGSATFESVHVQGARTIAEAARNAGVRRLIHLSGIGVDAQSRDAYIRCRALGEEAVREAFPGAVIFRPSVMFGLDDGFLNTLVALVTRMPAIPLFGRGGTRLRPVFVEDVAEAAARAVCHDPKATTFELGGPEDLAYRDILDRVMEMAGKRRMLLPFPFAGWHAVAAAGRFLPSPPVTPGQIALMERDNLPAPDMPGLADLGIDATPIDPVLREILARD